MKEVVSIFLTWYLGTILRHCCFRRALAKVDETGYGRTHTPAIQNKKHNIQIQNVIACENNPFIFHLVTYIEESFSPFGVL